MALGGQHISYKTGQSSIWRITSHFLKPTGCPSLEQRFCSSPHGVNAFDSPSCLLCSPWLSDHGFGLSGIMLCLSIRTVHVRGGSLLNSPCTARLQASKTKSKMAIMPPAVMANRRVFKGYRRTKDGVGVGYSLDGRRKAYQRRYVK